MALIFVLSSLQLQAPQVNEVPFKDKGLHFVEYAVLGFLVVHAGLRTWPHHGVLRAASVGVLIAVAWGVLDELHQAFVPQRQADAMDLAADVLGVLAGTAARLATRALRVERSRTHASAEVGSARNRDSNAGEET
jgi:VanZ family protein